MKELSLQEIKEIEIELLKTFDAFCKENGIKYFLSHGTLLGAVRYKKFIPWDDDVDVLVPREDYDRLLSLFSDGDRYKLFFYEKNSEFTFPYAKLCDMTTVKTEPGLEGSLRLGIDMDVFPLDYWDKDIKKAKREAKRLSKNRFYLNLTKLHKPDSVNPVKRFIKGIVMFFCKLYGSGYYIKKIHKDCHKPSQENSPYMGGKSWCVYGERDIIPSGVFSSSVMIEFEGAMFPAPADYHTYLTCLYGDYLPEPPKEKQKTHHNFKAYKL